MVVKNSKHRFIGVIDLGTTSVRFTGLWCSEKEINVENPTTDFSPGISPELRERLNKNWARAVERSRSWTGQN